MSTENTKRKAATRRTTADKLAVDYGFANRRRTNEVSAWSKAYLDVSYSIGKANSTILLSDKSLSKKNKDLAARAAWLILVNLKLDCSKTEKWKLRITFGDADCKDKDTNTIGTTTGICKVKDGVNVCDIGVADLPLWKAVKVLGHEMEHFAQKQRGDYVGKVDVEKEQYVTTYRGVDYINFEGPWLTKGLYATAPWEIDARSEENRLFGLMDQAFGRRWSQNDGFWRAAADQKYARDLLEDVTMFSVSCGVAMLIICWIEGRSPWGPAEGLFPVWACAFFTYMTFHWRAWVPSKDTLLEWLGRCSDCHQWSMSMLGHYCYNRNCPTHDWLKGPKGP